MTYDTEHRPQLLVDRYIPLGIVVAALAIYAAFVAMLPASWSENQSTDYLTYYAPVARQILAGHGFVTPEGGLALRYPPGYPLLLAGLFGLANALGLSEAAILAGFIGLSVAASSLLVYAIAASVGGRRVALLAALAWMTYPFHLWLAKQPNSEIPFFLPFLAAILVFLRALEQDRPRLWSGCAAGLLIGLASLIRPIALALGVPLILVVWFSPKGCTSWARLAFCACLLLGNLLAIAPWETWVWRETGSWIPLSTGGRLSMLDGLTVGAKTSASGSVLAVPDDVRALMQAVTDRRQELESTGDIVRFVASQLGSHPAAVVKLVALKAARAWYATDAQWFERYILILQLPYLLLAATGMRLAWSRGGCARRFTPLALLVTLYFWAMTITTLSILRYMVPALALLMVFVAIAIIAAKERLWAWHSRRLSVRRIQQPVNE